MKIKANEKSECAIDDVDSPSSRRSSGASGRPRGAGASRKAGQKSSSGGGGGRRLSDAMLDKYLQCDEADGCGAQNQGGQPEPGSGGELPSAAYFGQQQQQQPQPQQPPPPPPQDDAFDEERPARVQRPPSTAVEWPDEAARRAAEERARRKPAAKHIHPCVCDLSKRQRANIEQYLRQRQSAQQRFERRVHEIEEEIRLAEEAEQQRLRELEAEKEFYGDEYEMEGSKRKRKKRSARRASMVSLGVKQVINWRKPPKVEVRFTRTSNLRATRATYCKPPLPPLPEIGPVEVDFEQPEIPIRTTRTVELRLKFVKNHIEMAQQRRVKVKYPDRPPFVTKY